MDSNKVQMKKVLVTGSSGFIGGHLVRRLKSEGYYVVGIDLVEPPYSKPDLFYQMDLRNSFTTFSVFSEHVFEDVYNLACLMGGMGYIGDPAHNYDVMIGSTQIVLNVLDSSIKTGVKKIFYSSSACAYNENLQKNTDDVSLKESDAYPAMPDLVYGWQKLFSEQIHQAAKDKIEIRIARFHNIYGPEGTYKGGKEKAPAALCRKVASVSRHAKPGGRGIDNIDVWGDGLQTRSFLFIEDCIDAVLLLMNSDFKEPINIGSEEIISINDLAKMVIGISGYSVRIRNVKGPVGVRGRSSDNTMVKSVLGWTPKFTLKEGMKETYNWINEQINGIPS